MRLSENKIKSAISHGEQYVRDVALDYFSAAFSPDPTVMPQAIQSLSTYGWANAFTDNLALESLLQTDETVSWLIEELDSTEHTSQAILSEISWILAAANAGTLKRRRKDILNLHRLDPAARSVIVERTRLLSVDPASAWQELDDFCQRASAQRAIARAELVHISHSTEAVARHATEFGERVHSGLDRQLSGDDDVAQVYKSLFITRMAGLMHLESTIPLLVKRMASPLEEICEESCTALIRIGGDDVVKAVWNACATASAEMRDAVAWVLGGIHSDLAAEACLHLFQSEQDAAIKVNLGHAVLSQFEIDGLGPVRQFLLDAPADTEFTELRHNFLAVCSLMEAGFPELSEWRAELEQQVQFESQWQTPEFPVMDTWSAQVQEPPQTPKRTPRAVRPTRSAAPQQRIGRNAPCPCGSGKKYKDCCRRARLGG